ncbi:hypothetical protein Bca4012_045512 [Brassica carinata]
MTAYLKWVQAWSSIVDKRTCKLRGRGGRRRRLYSKWESRRWIFPKESLNVSFRAIPMVSNHPVRVNQWRPPTNGCC